MRFILTVILVFLFTLLKAQKNYSELDSFTIKSGVDSTVNTTFYMLTAVTRDKSLKVAGYLELKDQSFLLIPYPYGTVICSGCENACAPFRKNGNWICSGSCNELECNKTETVRHWFYFENCILLRVTQQILFPWFFIVFILPEHQEYANMYDLV